ncbi:MAG: HYR domain-containing protein, partial [Bacteroidia bacterium]|nr:HYR domain-containing protein [Bacteroidia bacterium]
VPATTGQCGAIVTYTATAIDQCPSGSTTVFSENFQGGGSGWTLNVNSGSNAATAPNSWEVNATEGGVAPPGCGVANNGDLTLHITCTSAFCGSLITGAVYNANKLTNKRAESPAFVTSGYSSLTLNFNFISNGSGLLDNASVVYNDGSGWQTLTASIKSPVCGGGQGQWTAYTATLPASCNNNPNVKIGFNWTNNADNIGTDPSVAINDITVTAPGSAASTIAYTPNSGSFFPIGTTTVTAIATDGALLDDTCTFTVTVTDNEVPVISSCPTNITIAANNAGCTGIATWTAPGVSDNCVTGLSLNSTHTSGAVFPVGTTTITYTATDGSGNSSLCSFNVTVTNDLDASVSAADALCNGDSTGAALMFIISGTPTYSYAWNPYGANIGNPNNLIAGTYTCTITDAIGCSIVRTAIINDPPAISSSQSPTICSGQSFMVGTNSYSAAATYIDTLTAANGCDSVVTTVLSVIPSPTVSISSNLTAIECQGSVDTLIANGANTFSWSTSSANDTIIITHATGTTQWIVTGTDPNGCSDIDTVSITGVSIPTPVFFDLSPDTVCLNAGNISLTGGVPMGGMYSGAGVTGSNFNSFSAGSGTHFITYSVLNANGCISSDSALMLVDLCLGTANNLKLNSGAVIYPNPSNGNFILESTSNGELEIYNSLGEIVLKQKIQTGKNKLKIETAQNGIYLAKVYSENGMQVIRVVKQE